MLLVFIMCGMNCKSADNSYFHVVDLVLNNFLCVRLFFIKFAKLCVGFAKVQIFVELSNKSLTISFEIKTVWLQGSQTTLINLSKRQVVRHKCFVKFQYICISKVKFVPSLFIMSFRPCQIIILHLFFFWSGK